jgi:DNA-binding Lrp family transcriptional regulator
LVIAYVLINTKPGAEEKVYSELAAMANVSEIYTLFGEYDIIVKVDAKDYAVLENFIVSKIRNISGIVDTKTLMVIKL